MTGVEIAWRTLNLEKVNEPCIVASWMMKRDFFRHYTGVEEIYSDPVTTVVEAFANAGANLNCQFIMPSPFEEHLACDPFNLPTHRLLDGSHRTPKNLTPEDVRDECESLPDPSTLEREFDLDQQAKSYAKRLLDLRHQSNDRTLFIGHFGMPAFMSGYSHWTYESYLTALLLYPESLQAMFRLNATSSRLYNLALVEAVRKHNLAPFVYGGDDICFNDGPMCSVGLLDKLYFPNLEYALEPLVENGIRIVWHCDGNVLPIIDRLIAMGIAGFQGFQEAEANIPLGEVARRRTREGGKLILFGSVSVTSTLPFGTVGDVKREVERCYNLAAPGGGFCLASTSSILPETPLENIIALFEHGRGYGREVLG